MLLNTESLKRVKGCSYGELDMSVKGRFPTAGWIQCCLHGIIKQGKGFADHVGKGSVPTAGWIHCLHGIIKEGKGFLI